MWLSRTVPGLDKGRAGKYKSTKLFCPKGFLLSFCLFPDNKQALVKNPSVTGISESNKDPLARVCMGQVSPRGNRGLPWSENPCMCAYVCARGHV